MPDLDPRSEPQPAPGDPQRRFATQNEKPLHAALKAWYAEPGDRVEAPLDGAVIDIVRGQRLIEIQTVTVSAIRHKLARLAERHPVRLVIPIAAQKWIVRVDDDGVILSRRRSPKRGALVDAFAQVASIPALLARPGFEVEVLLTRQDEYRRHEPGRAWRRKGWVIDQRRLLTVEARHLFAAPDDWLTLLSADLPRPFTTAHLADALGCPRRLAGQMAYTLHGCGALDRVGKAGRAWLYAEASGDGA